MLIIDRQHRSVFIKKCGKSIKKVKLIAYSYRIFPGITGLILLITIKIEFYQKIRLFPFLGFLIHDEFMIEIFACIFLRVIED